MISNSNDENTHNTINRYNNQLQPSWCSFVMCPALTDRHCAALSAKAHSGSDVITTACKGQNYEEELDFVCNFFTNDFNKIELAAELLTLRTFYGTEVAADEKPSVNSIKTALLALSTMQRKLLGAVVRLFQLLVTLPATNATSERSFSALRRIKSYLRSTMSQVRLNHLMILHYHQEMTDRLDLKCIANEYIMKNESRRITFACYTFPL